jgi:hypothetical protein
MITLDQAKSAPLDGTAFVEFASRPGVKWAIVGRYPDDERHPEKVRVLVNNDEFGQSYFTENHLARVTPIFYEPEPDLDPVIEPEVPAEAPQTAPSGPEAGETVPVGTVSYGPETTPVVPVPGEPMVEAGSLSVDDPAVLQAIDKANTASEEAAQAHDAAAPKKSKKAK